LAAKAQDKKLYGFLDKAHQQGIESMSKFHIVEAEVRFLRLLPGSFSSH